MPLEIGTRIGRYRILALLGRGGMADVYRAEDERLGREVALKVVPPEFARDPERVKRFEHEVRAATQLTHPNIVTVYEFGQCAGQHFYTMALMPGGDLKALIRANPDGMPPREAQVVAEAMARALDYAHGQGIVHRDVKPENILFGQDKTPQLTDFGIARVMSSGARLTATGMSIGSPRYMSPEQARGRAVDGRSDLYSLGVVLFEMLTGRVPFDAEEDVAVAYAHVNDSVPGLPEEHAAWRPVLDRLLAKLPDDRYRSGGELAEALKLDPSPQASGTRLMSVQGDNGLSTRVGGVVSSETQHAKRRRSIVAGLAGGLVALAVVGTGYVALHGTDSSERISSNASGAESSVRPAQRPNALRLFESRNPESVRLGSDLMSPLGGDAVMLGMKPSSEVLLAAGKQRDQDGFEVTQRSADQGDAAAQYSLGNRYYRGEGVGQDHAEAARWYRLAADQGNSSAQENLSRLVFQ